MTHQPSVFRRVIMLSLFGILGIYHSGQSQDVGNLVKDAPWKKTPVKVTGGGISANSIFYASNSDQRRNPFSYYLAGNINFSIFGWSMPLTFSYSNQQFSYLQSFNQFTFNPSYKWVSSHLGYQTMSFSSYSLNGHQFYGVGLNLTPPGKFSYSVMYGRMLRAVQPAAADSNLLPVYKRMGYGAMVTYTDKAYTLSASLFRAKDDTSSISTIFAAERGVTPKENIVIDVSGGITLSKNIRATFEFANSALTSDLRTLGDSTGKRNLLLYKNLSTTNNQAFKAGINYTLGTFGMGINYERIAPGYATLGAYYNLNDYQYLSFNFSQGLFKNKLIVSGNAGLQQNDLDNKTLSNMKQLMMGLNMTYMASKQLQMTASYNNFQSYTHIKTQFENLTTLTPYDNIDTLNFTSISRQATYTVNYLLGSDKKTRQMLSGTFTYQGASSKQGTTTNAYAGSDFYNSVATYSLTKVPSNLTLSLSGNVTYNDIAGQEMLAFGPSLAINKMLFRKKLKVNGSFAYNSTRLNGTTTSSIFNIRGGTSYTLMRKHQFSLTLLSLLRYSSTATTLPPWLREFTATAGYNYSF